jgi:acyl transferase domain-containing protein/acyl-CoA synthetase (AMP-forming)/AMP-acid ligase II/acyl carrier protein
MKADNNILDVWGGSIRSLVHVLQERAQRSPEREHLVFLRAGEVAEGTLTYGGLEVRARAVAAAIQARFSGRGRALLLLPPGLSFVEAFYGCLFAGWVAVPTYPPEPGWGGRVAERTIHIARDAGVDVVLATSAIAEAVLASAQQLGQLKGAEWISVDRVDSALASSYRSAMPDAQSLALLQYTSGSTGDPRGVMLTHGNLLANERMSIEKFRVGCDDVVVGWLPLFHDMGLIGNVLQPMCAGYRCVLMSPLSFLKHPIRWLRAIHRYQGSIGGGPNFAYELCVEKIEGKDREGLDLSSWKVAFNGSEPVRSSTLERFARAYEPFGFSRNAFAPCYGLAEASLLVTSAERGGGATTLTVDRRALGKRCVKAPASGELGVTLVGCGAPPRGTEVRIVSEETGELLGERDVGEIWVSSGSVAVGYWQREGESGETFDNPIAGDSHRWLRTGDLGFLNLGELYVVGRVKDIIIIRGQNHYPQDIEATVELSHSAIRTGHVAAMSAEVDDREVVIIAAEVLKRYAKAAGGGLEGVATAVLSAVTKEHGVPVHRVLLLKPGTIPRTTSGKIRRRACLEAHRAGKLCALGDFGPDVGSRESGKGAMDPNRLERWLAAEIGHDIGIDPGAIDLDAAFVSLGLDSAKAVSLIGRLENHLGTQLDVGLLFNFPTIRSLAKRLGTGDDVLVEVPSFAKAELVAVVGVGCRFPGRAHGPSGFWSFLCSRGADGISRSLDERFGHETIGHLDGRSTWDMGTGWAGCIDDVQGFDAAFFGIPRSEAEAMDPQHRLILEVAYEALEDAGIPKEMVAGSRTGVFIGICTSDYAWLNVKSPTTIGGYSGTGTAHSIAANRLSYLLDLHGPSMSVDTACSSSLVAVHLGCQSLRQGECEMALVGGVNLMLSPEASVNLSKARMLSPDGRCRTFDAEANGYVRGEGCGVLVLKRLSDAQAAGDRVMAVIRGSAVNQDGRSNGLTAPNGVAQEAVIREALGRSGCAGRDVDYVEAHGTGTPLGDPIEVQSLGKAYCSERGEGGRLKVGSVKTNIGHLEAAAGVAGMIKVALALEHGAIPAHLHFQKPNPHIAFEALGIEVVKELTPWSRRESRARRAGVSSFGFGGTNAHVIMEEGTWEEGVVDDGARKGSGCQLLCLSGKTESAVLEQSNRHSVYLREHGEQRLEDVCYTLQMGRTHYEHRIVAVGATSEEVGRELLRMEVMKSKKLERGQVAFVFGGQGAQRGGMGHSLYEREPVFRAALDRCAAVAEGKLKRPLLATMFGEEGAALDETGNTQPALFALEWGLVELWKSWGVEPGRVLGHSVGEYVAAVVAGVMTMEDGLELVIERAALMQELPHNGAMAAIRCGEAVAQEEVQREELEAAIAAVNGPESTVISGERGAIERIVARLQGRGIVHRMLTVSHAFHSPLMQPMIDGLRRAAERCQTAEPRIAMVSNVTGELHQGAPNGEYWATHALRPVRYADGMTTLRMLGCDVFIEVGPDPVLLTMARQYLLEPELEWLPSLSNGSEEQKQMLQSLGRLYTLGAEIKWHNLHHSRRRKVSLPTYPFEHERYWLQAPQQAAASAEGQRRGHPLLGRRTNVG